jgi:Collagenase and related proteases
MFKIPELLAPAGGMEQLKAAVENGADAVYMGGKLFNARINAKNFDDDEMERAIDYAHVRGVRLYITMNTLIRDS